MKKNIAIILLCIATVIVACTAVVANAQLRDFNLRDGVNPIGYLDDSRFHIRDDARSDIQLPSVCYTKIIFTGNVEDEVLICRKGNSVKYPCLGTTIVGCAGREGYEYFCSYGGGLQPPHNFNGHIGGLK